ncbi:MAG: EAL domain-containing protein [Ilumatobacteraceae bacterium]
MGFALCGVHFLLPTETARQVLYTVIALSLAVIAVIALRRDRPHPMRGWATLTAGLVMVGLAELLCVVFVERGVWAETESAINVGFITAYGVQLVGLMLIIQSRTTGRSRSSWLDAGAVGVATFTVVWTLMHQQIVERAGSTMLDWVIQILEPIVGVLSIAMSLRLVMGERGGHSVFGLLCLGYIVQTTTDLTAYVAEERIAVGLATMWLVAYVCFGAGMLHPGRLLPPKQAPSARARREVTEALALQGALIVMVVGAIVWRATPLVETPILAMWAGAGAIMLVFNRLRVYSLVRMVGDASATESHRRLTALVDNSHEIIALADPDGILRYVSSSVELVTGVPAEEWLGVPFSQVVRERTHQIDDFDERMASLAPGERTTWEGEISSPLNLPPTTLRITVVNHVDTPEVNGWVITARDVTDEARLTSELRHQALHDTLTGLPNRALLFDRIEHALERVSRTPSDELAVALVDLDEFKSVNDSLGHDTGDILLQGVAARLLRAVRPGDTVARLGGDEFALLLEGTTEVQAMAVAQRALESLALPIQLGDVDFTANASIGLVCHRGPAAPLELLRYADIAMYEAKREGKARVKVFREHMHHAARNQLELRMNLAAALERDEFSVLYQPIIDTDHFQVCGVEALLRWQHPVRGFVPPSEFIPVAEQSGLLAPIGEWVLRRACAEAATWPGGDSEHAPYISVNVSAAQISRRGFVTTVMGALADTGLPPSRLLLEVTETMLVDDDALARDVLAQLRSAGVRIAIDDFGTGYSSLAYLRQLSVDVVKIDQSFVRDLDTNSDHQALTRTMLALSVGLSMTAIAEGVETESELAELRALGCGFAQGYLFSYPIDGASIALMLAEQEAGRQPVGVH